MPRMGIDFQSLGVAGKVGRTQHLELLVHPMCSTHVRTDAICCEAARLFDWQVLSY